MTISHVLQNRASVDWVESSLNSISSLFDVLLLKLFIFLLVVICLILFSGVVCSSCQPKIIGVNLNTNRNPQFECSEKGNFIRCKELSCDTARLLGGPGPVVHTARLRGGVGHASWTDLALFSEVSEVLGPASGELYAVIVFKARVLAFLGCLWSCLISPFPAPTILLF